MNDFELDNWEYSCGIKGRHKNSVFKIRDISIKIPDDGEYHAYIFIKYEDRIQIILDNNTVYDSHLSNNSMKPKISAKNRELQKIERSYWRHL
jgi:hypothetical protein